MTYRTPVEYHATAAKLIALHAERLSENQRSAEAARKAHAELVAIGDVWSAGDLLPLLFDAERLVKMQAAHIERLREVEQHADVEIMDDLLRDCWAENDEICQLDEEVRQQSAALAEKWAAEDAEDAA
jgi:hypothetical protein